MEKFKRYAQKNTENTVKYCSTKNIFIFHVQPIVKFEISMRLPVTSSKNFMDVSADPS